MRNEIEFDVVEGRLKFSYHPQGGLEPVFSGFVPEEVISKEEEVILAYVRGKISRHQEEERTKKRIARERWQQLNVPIWTKHEQEMLKGRIVCCDDLDCPAVTVILESPAQLKEGRDIIRGWDFSLEGFEFSAEEVFQLSDFRLSDEEGSLTAWAFEESRCRLIRLYEEGRAEHEKRKSNPRAYNIAQWLNRREELEI